MQEIGDLVDTMNVQIQRAIKDGLKSQLLREVQKVLRYVQNNDEVGLNSPKRP